VYAKNYDNWLRVDKVIAMKGVCSFFGPHCMLNKNARNVLYYLHGYLFRQNNDDFCHRPLTFNLRRLCVLHI